MSDVGSTALARRWELALSQEELSELAGVSVRFVRELEHGKPTIRLDKALAVLDALGLVFDVKVRRA